MTRLKKVPLRRIVRDARGSEYVVEMQEGTLRIRPLRSRRGGAAEAAIGWGSLYIRAYQPPQRKRKVRRGLL